ncbi:MAG: ATP-binding protein [Phycisphaerales bacterium]|nr:ATP-binding protein [Phycisphaerales bacterium]
MVDQNKHPDLRLEFFSRPVFLGVIRRMLDALFVRIGIDQKKAAQLCLAVDEAITNIIRHGYENDPDGRIELRVTVQTEPTPELILELLDQAKCVDLDTIRSRDLEDIRPGGLGVHLIKEIMEQAEYSHRPEGGMRLVMRYPLPEEPIGSTNQDG